jgi:hypothetical protein
MSRRKPRCRVRMDLLSKHLTAMALRGGTVPNSLRMATQWLHGTIKAKPRYLYDSGVSFAVLVPER